MPFQRSRKHFLAVDTSDRLLLLDTRYGCEWNHALRRPGERRCSAPTVEGGYEAVAAIVLERRPRWYRIVLPVGSGWVRLDDTRRFIPLTRLFATRMTYLRSGVLMPLAAEPGAPSTAAARPLATDVPARVVATRRLDGMLWLHGQGQEVSD